MKDSLVIKLLYETIPGRMLLKLLVHPGLSKVAAQFFSGGCSRWLVPVFIRSNSIDISGYVVPEGGYKSFNDFFTRRRREDCCPKLCGGLVSPCDGLLTVSDITKDSVFRIKNTAYSVAGLLKSEKLSKQFIGGTAYIFRLTPAHYHRYSFCATGAVTSRKRIPGVLHSVQPVCHEMTDVFIQNSREFITIDNSEYGKILQMEVGALLVGRISNHQVSPRQQVQAGKEKGYFEYGGSSIVVLTGKRTELAEEIKNRERLGDEIPVFVGEKLLQDLRVSP